MTKDPWTLWDGPFPYDVLARAGISPASTRQEVLDASFSLMAAGEMSAVERQAWDELRNAERREVVDFFLYSCDLAAEATRALELLHAQPPPWQESSGAEPPAASSAERR